jgi:threonine dehydrogenase-like Zn-dependent dehydrogenase
VPCKMLVCMKRENETDMKAIAIHPGTTQIQLIDRPEPTLTAPDQVKLRVLRVGICGTDREEAKGGRAEAPKGHSELILGHEMFGQVTEVGSQVKHVKKGDYAALTVRRGCGKCLPCLMNRSDMCQTGNYRERGIKGLDGYQTEYVVDQEQYLVQIPSELEAVGVLSEPLSVAEKAIDEALRIQAARLPEFAATPDWLHGRRCLVAGLGPIGLLAALALRLRGAQVFGLDIVDEDSPRPQWLKKIGGQYVDGRRVPADKVDDTLGPMAMILEGTGVYVLTGVPGGDRPLQIPGAALIRQLVLQNQVMLGSVNAARDHFQMAVDDLGRARLQWGDHLEKLITQHHAYTDFESALQKHPDDEIKSVIEWK